MYEHWYDYKQPQYEDNAKLCYTDMDSFIVQIKFDGIYADLTRDVEKTFNTLNYEAERLLLIEKKSNRTNER